MGEILYSRNINHVGGTVFQTPSIWYNSLREITEIWNFPCIFNILYLFNQTDSIKTWRRKREILLTSKISHWNIWSNQRRTLYICLLISKIQIYHILKSFLKISFFFRSNKLKPFWLSITEKESLPVLDFLTTALMSVEYDRALSRALAMAECPVVPFFGAFLRELREILETPSLVRHSDAEQGDHHHHSSTSSNKPPKSDSRRDQMQHQRQVVGEKWFSGCKNRKIRTNCYLELNEKYELL